jgi:hypothetical protein
MVVVIYKVAGEIRVNTTAPAINHPRASNADYKVKDDTIWLDNAVFAKLGKSGSAIKPAALNKAFFTIGPKAKDKNDYIIYDNKNGYLYYDANGSSAKSKQVLVATLSKKLKMAASEFYVI